MKMSPYRVGRTLALIKDVVDTELDNKNTSMSHIYGRPLRRKDFKSRYLGATIFEDIHKIIMKVGFPKHPDFIEGARQ